MPERIVGFPLRSHYTEDGETLYNAETANDVSIILTGVAFYHNYYNYIYTYRTPGKLKNIKI